MGGLNFQGARRKSLAAKRERQHREDEARRRRNHATAAAAKEQIDEHFANAAPSFVTPSNKLSSKPETITPEIAMQWLEGQCHNRPLNHVKAMAYCQDMAAERWDLNGESIIFDWNGVLQDGQHRLWACIESKTAFSTMVVRGVDPATFRTIDTGRARRASDVLAIENFKDTYALAAAAAIVINYEAGTLRSGRRHGQYNREILEFNQNNPALTEWVIKARRKPSAIVATSVAAVLFIGAKTYSQEAEAFLQRFKTGEGLTAGSPILTVRNRLLTDRGLRRDEKIELIIRAWNASIEGRVMQIARTSPSAPFPWIVGDPRR